MNGESALNFFKEKKADIDLIISDIQMPKMDGIALLKEIRAIDLKELFNKIDNIFYEKMNKVKSNLHKIQIETYLDGNIVYVNDMCCKVFKYEKEELLSQSYRIILDSHISKEKLDHLKQIIRNGDKWQGQIKHEAKDKTPFYTAMTIFPLHENEDDKISGYIVINFLVTDIIEEKRVFKKNIISSIVDYKKDHHHSLKKISLLEENLKKANNDIRFYQEEKNILDLKYKKSINQINFYEQSIKEKDSQYKKSLEMYKANFEKINTIYKNLSNETKKNRQDISKLKEEDLLKTKEITSLNSRLNEQAKIIIGLRDTISNIK